MNRDTTNGYDLKEPTRRYLGDALKDVLLSESPDRPRS